MSGWCPEGVRKVSGRCSASDWRVSGRFVTVRPLVVSEFRIGCLDSVKKICTNLIGIRLYFDYFVGLITVVPK